jgi:hypothetical protein
MNDQEFAQGQSFAEYLAAMKENRRRVERIYQEISLSDSQRTELASVVSELGGLDIVFIAEDWCGDAAMILPFLARMGEEPGVKLRCFVRSQHPELIPAGVKVIPVVRFFDPTWHELGQFIERSQSAHQRVKEFKAAHPEMAALQASTAPEDQEKLKEVFRGLLGQMENWYREGLYQETLAEMLAAIRGVAR